MAATNDTDVERAVAAFGAPSMTYRTFRPESPTPVAAIQTENTATEFPLLVAALPEAASILGLARAPSTAIASPVEDTTPLSQSAEIWPSPASLLSREPPPPSAANLERDRRGTDARPATPEQAVRCTQLASMFRMLRSEPVRQLQPSAPRPTLLRALFQRL